MRYRYSKDIVYNNFVLQSKRESAQKNREYRSRYFRRSRLISDSSLVDLYDERSMPPELRKAHQAKDRTVMNTDGFDVKSMTETSCVVELMKLYSNLEKSVANFSNKH